MSSDESSLCRIATDSMMMIAPWCLLQAQRQRRYWQAADRQHDDDDYLVVLFNFVVGLGLT